MERPAEKQTFKINIERRPSRSTIPTRSQPGEASHAICFGMDALARQDVRQADNNQESDVEVSEIKEKIARVCNWPNATDEPTTGTIKRLQSQ